MSKEKLDEKDLENVSGGAGMRSVSRESTDERADENHEEEEREDGRSRGTNVGRRGVLATL